MSLGSWVWRWAQSGGAGRGATFPSAETMGLPPLTITVKDDGFQLPAKLPARRYFVTVKNVGKQDGHVFLLRVPDAVTDKPRQADLHASPGRP